MRDALMRLLEPPIEALGFELVDIEFARRGAAVCCGSSSIATQRMPGASVTVDDCARVSHAVSEVLEAEDPIKGHYTLEVSSPGFDRILRKRAHFERFVGERIFVELKLPHRRAAALCRGVEIDRERLDRGGSGRAGVRAAARANSEGERLRPE